MKKHILLAAVALVALTGAHNAQAGDDWRKGLYIKGAAGWNHTQDQDITGNTESELDEGYAISGAVGYDYGDLRSEFEITYRHNGVDGISAAGAPLASPDGDLKSTAFMVNGYYDIPTGGPFTPYVGAGIGLAHVVTDDFTSAGATVADGSDNVFAYQGMVGAEYAATSNVGLFAEYKYFATSDIDMGTNTEGDYHNHAIMAGVKYDLN